MGALRILDGINAKTKTPKVRNKTLICGIDHLRYSGLLFSIVMSQFCVSWWSKTVGYQYHEGELLQQGIKLKYIVNYRVKHDISAKIRECEEIITLLAIPIDGF